MRSARGPLLGVSFRLFLVSLFAFGLLARPAFSGEIEDLFVQGNRYYDNGDYENAAREYQKILDRGIHNSEVYFNLGNSFYKLNKLGGAILNYERALRLNPNGPDILKNLDFVKSQIVDVIPTEESFFAFVFKKIINFFNLNELTIALVGLYLVFSLLVLLLILLRKSLWKRIIKTLCILAAVFLILFGTLFGTRIYLYSFVKEAVIVKENVYVRSGPSDSYVSLFEVHEGLKVRIRGTHEDWVQISLSNGLNGWASKQDLEMI